MLHVLLDLLYPARCVSCGVAGDWWCASCRACVEHLPVDPCHRCASVETDHDADACAGALPFAGITSTGFYHSPPLRRLIAALKYDGLTDAASSVDAYLRDALAERSAPLPWQREVDVMIIPMPLADRRERERGFNQAAWVAQRLRAGVGIPWSGDARVAPPVLIRRTGKYAQADLEHDLSLRRANIAGQFQAVGRVDYPVLLVDDVVTTGSTAAEAARALMGAGAPRVYLFTLAVGA